MAGVAETAEEAGVTWVGFGFGLGSGLGLALGLELG